MASPSKSWVLAKQTPRNRTFLNSDDAAVLVKKLKKQCPAAIGMLPSTNKQVFEGTITPELGQRILERLQKFSKKDQKSLIRAQECMELFPGTSHRCVAGLIDLGTGQTLQKLLEGKDDDEKTIHVASVSALLPQSNYKQIQGELSESKSIPLVKSLRQFGKEGLEIIELLPKCYKIKYGGYLSKTKIALIREAYENPEKYNASVATPSDSPQSEVSSKRNAATTSRDETKTSSPPSTPKGRRRSERKAVVAREEEEDEETDDDKEKENNDKKTIET